MLQETNTEKHTPTISSKETSIKAKANPQTLSEERIEAFGKENLTINSVKSKKRTKTANGGLQITEKPITKNISILRNSIPDLVAQKYMEDYKFCLSSFPENFRVEFTEHLLECLNLLENYLLNSTEETRKGYIDNENSFLRKHGKRLRTYNQRRFYLYYGDKLILSEKDIYTTKEWNKLPQEQKSLNKEEYSQFIQICRNRLYNERHYLLLEQLPEDERNIVLAAESGLHANNLNQNETIDYKTGRKRKITRSALDKMTCLNQEQTALLAYYLQKERVFLKGEYLNDREIGVAFEVLTGYSRETIRQTVGKFAKSISVTNLKEIDQLLTRVKKSIGEDMKGI